MKNFRESSSIELSHAEIEILYNYFNDQSNFSTWGGRSVSVEQGVRDMLNFFKNHYPEIAEIYKNPEIRDHRKWKTSSARYLFYSIWKSWRI
ncbi:MAG: hypothetical protein ACTSRP_22720 [Candidatus Helarchaeota archaeon]